ncbi:SDR family oxidoreductase [Brevibacterium antiquum]|uniref:SDR family oxidoreductase n=1 Tax=Brevibacterium antiquum TaxID=234835 RepID=UPI0018E0563E|nr:SDR family oxidoreductase [Brevibacterium antiquum]
MHLNSSTALVTGAGRGIGRAFVDELLARGATKVYATARDDSSVIRGPRVVPMALDITDTEAVDHAASIAGDVDVLINNAGLSTLAPLATGAPEDIRREMEINYFGTLAMVRAFAPILAGNGGGSILNVSSVMSWLGMEHSGSYGASKAAVWSMTNSLRIELSGQNTQVTGLHMASTDTDMMSGFDVPKNTPHAVAAAALDGLEVGDLEILADDDTRSAKANLSGDPAEVYSQAVRHRLP